MKKGIGLLDVIVSIALISILVTLLYQSLNQTGKTVRKIDEAIDVNMQLAQFVNRFEKDVSGIFLSHEFLKSREKFLENKENKQENKTEKKKEKEELQCIDKTCANILLRDMNIKEKVKGLQNGLFTFLTTNPLFIYKEKIPRNIRVVYYFLPENNKNLFRLIRYETQKTDYDTFEEFFKVDQIDGHTLLNNIVDFEIRCIQKNIDKEGNLDIDYYDNFNENDLLKDEKTELLPNFIEVSGILLKKNKKTPLDFKFLFPIYVKTPPIEKNKEENKNQPQNQQPQNNQRLQYNRRPQWGMQQ